MGHFPAYISYGVSSIDLDGTIFNVKAIISSVYPRKTMGDQISSPYTEQCPTKYGSSVQTPISWMHVVRSQQ